MAPVLIVDDDEDVRFILVACLEGQYDVLTANNAFEALKVFRETDISLVITDLRMPRADGTLLIGLLREMRPQVPIVAVTAYFDTMTRSRDRLLQQVDHLLEKPFMSREILEIVEKLIGPPTHPPPPSSSTLSEWKKLHQVLGYSTNEPAGSEDEASLKDRLARARRERDERFGT